MNIWIRYIRFEISTNEMLRAGSYLINPNMNIVNNFENIDE